MVQNMKQRAANVQATKMTRKNAYMVVTMIDYDEGSCCCHSCQNRKGECRESWYRHGDKPVAAPSQVEEADHLFSSLQSLTNYRVNNKLSKVFWRNASQKKWSNSTLVTQAGGQLPAVISNQRSSQVGVRDSEECGREQRKTKNFASYKKPSRFIIFMSVVM